MEKSDILSHISLPPESFSPSQRALIKYLDILNHVSQK